MSEKVTPEQVRSWSLEVRIEFASELLESLWDTTLDFVQEHFPEAEPGPVELRDFLLLERESFAKSNTHVPYAQLSLVWEAASSSVALICGQDALEAGLEAIRQRPPLP